MNDKTRSSQTPITTINVGSQISIIINGDEYGMITEPNGNTFLILASYIEQEVDDIHSPYGNGPLEI